MKEHSSKFNTLKKQLMRLFPRLDLCLKQTGLLLPSQRTPPCTAQVLNITPTPCYMGFVGVSIEYEQGTQITPPHPSQPGEDRAEQSNETVGREKVSPDKSRFFLRGEAFNGGLLWQLSPTEHQQRNVVEDVREDQTGSVQKHRQGHRKNFSYICSSV